MNTNNYSNRKLGKALPQHKLMQNLLCNFYSESRATKSTQTCEIVTMDRDVDAREITDRRRSLTECCCRDEAKVKRGKSRHDTKDIIDLISSLREKILKQDDVCCCCGDGGSDSGWSDIGADCPEDVLFPRETRQAVMSMLADEKVKKHRHRHHQLVANPPAPPPPPRYELLSPLQDKKYDFVNKKRLNNLNISQEILAQIRLSKNKLDVK